MDKIKVVILDENGEPIKVPLKEKAKALWEKAKATAEPATAYIREHPAESFAAAAGFLGLCKTAKSVFGKSPAEKRQETVLHQYYDPSTGLHWQLKRELTNRERAELMARKRQGEFTEEILEDFGVLK